MDSASPTDTAPDELESVAAAAVSAAAAWGEQLPPVRARALRAAADALDAATDELVTLADAETFLGDTRLRGEVARTSGQLRMFAERLDDSGYLEAIVTPAAAGRPDVRRMLVPVGPVAVFAASNFPFAFSVAGGDTASALAAGCPVVLKAHEGHPSTSARTAEIVAAALHDAGAPAGAFGIVFGRHAGRDLVRHPDIRAVGFTGSLAGGRALLRLTHERADPIPFYGELGSINPGVVLPAAARERGAEIAAGYVASLTQGTGQFCTNPGLLFVPGGDLLGQVASALADASGGRMLTDRMREAYERDTTDPAWTARELVGRGRAEGAQAVVPQVRSTSLDSFAADVAAATGEVFGPAGLVVTYDEPGALGPVLAQLPGSLAASVHAAGADGDLVPAVAAPLRRLAGRLIMNSWPTGVAVCWAMHHGGPWPATTAPAHTSVGATALRRWLIPVAYQDWPDELLPPALQQANPLGVPRTVQP